MRSNCVALALTMACPCGLGAHAQARAARAKERGVATTGEQIEHAIFASPARSAAASRSPGSTLPRSIP